MNRLLTFIVVMAGSLTFMACEQENNNIELPQNDLVKIDIVAETPETRTYINEAQNRVEWSENDAIMVFENNKGKSSTATSISNGKATFSVSFAKSSNAPFYYNAIYPAASYIDDGSDITEARLETSLYHHLDILDLWCCVLFVRVVHSRFLDLLLHFGTIAPKWS